MKLITNLVDLVWDMDPTLRKDWCNTWEEHRARTLERYSKSLQPPKL